MGEAIHGILYHKFRKLSKWKYNNKPIAHKNVPIPKDRDILTIKDYSKSVHKAICDRNPNYKLSEAETLKAMRYLEKQFIKCISKSYDIHFTLVKFYIFRKN